MLTEVNVTYYEITATDKRSLISEGVVVTRIDIHSVREEPDQHIVCATLGVSRTTIVCEVPTKSKSAYHVTYHHHPTRPYT
jgi:hypothetical protein